MRVQLLEWHGPLALAAETAPRVIAWVNRVDDLAWLEVDDAGWHDRGATGDALRPLLAEIGRVYAPFLLGNAAALDAKAAEVECTIDDARWVQAPFPYQGKCLRWLRERHAALSAADRVWVDDTVAGTGCDTLFAN